MEKLAATRKWMPIDTAPKDGTKFLAWWAHSAHSCRWGSGPYDRKTKTYVGGWSIGMARDAKPTHWMPLPEPPNASEG